MNGGQLQLLDGSGARIAQATMNGNGVQTFTFTPYTCDTSFQGGGWVLVRRVRQGSTTWHPATDDLAGTQAAYGTYGSATSDATFGIPYSSWVSSSTEFLFATGNLDCNLSLARDEIVLMNVGDQSKWLMTTWDAIYNNGVSYAATYRNVTRSSFSAIPCTCWMAFAVSMFDFVLFLSFLFFQPGHGLDSSFVSN